MNIAIPSLLVIRNMFKKNWEKKKREKEGLTQILTEQDEIFNVIEQIISSARRVQIVK